MQIDDQKLREMVDRAAELTEVARELSEKDRDFYDGFQWTAAEQAILRKRKQPIVTDNLIRRKVDAMVGIEQRGRVDPRALPRNPDDEQAADIATKALAYVDDVTRLDAHRSQFCYNLGIEGYGGVEVTTRERKGKIDPDVIRLRWEEIFFDPFSREADFSDASYMGVQKWMALDAAVAFAQGYTDKPKEELEALFDSCLLNSTGTTYDDRPLDAAGQAWGDKKNKRVKLAYLYYKSAGKWYLALVAGKATIYNELSPYLDEDGNPENAIILQACYVDRENRRYGVVRDWISPQEETNKRRSKLLHMLNSRQTMGQAGATTLKGEALKRELAAPDGHIEYEQDPQSNVPSFQVIPMMDQITGQFQLLEYTTQMLTNLGPNPSVMGEESAAQSGRAIMAMQQAGMAELAPFYDALRDWTLRVYRAIWNRIKQFWTDERWIRVTDEPDKLQFVGVNVPKQQPVVDPMTGQPAVGPDGQPMMQPVVGPDGKPMLENEVGQLDIDIIIDTSPEYATLQQEQFEVMADLVSKGMLQLPPDVIIKASSLRNKAELVEALNSPEQQQQAQMMQQMQQRMADLEAKVLETKAADQAASAQLKQAQAQAEMAEIGRPETGQPADPKPMIDAQIKREAMRVDVAKHRETLGEQARQHDDKMMIEAARLRNDAAKAQADAATKRAQVGADIRFKGDQSALARDTARTDSKVKAAQAAKLRRPDPKPAKGK